MIKYVTKTKQKLSLTLMWSGDATKGREVRGQASVVYYARQGLTVSPQATAPKRNCQISEFLGQRSRDKRQMNGKSISTPE